METKFYTTTINPTANNQPITLRSFIFRTTVIALALAFMGIALFAQQPLSGRILDKETGIPLPYATVSLPNTSPLQETTTDEYGHFEFDQVPEGEHRIEVNYMDYEPLILTGVQVRPENQESVVLGMQEERIRKGELFTQTLSGRVMDADSKLPVPYALVTLPGTTPELEAVTDEFGQFRIENVPAGLQTVEVHTQDYETYILSGVNIPIGKQVVAPLKVKEIASEATSHRVEQLIF